MLDKAALIACMAYVDLNPVSALMAETPESSHYTLILQKINELKDNALAKAGIQSI